MRQAALRVVEATHQLRVEPEAHARLTEGAREAIVWAAVGEADGHAALVRVGVRDGARVDRRLRAGLGGCLPERHLQTLAEARRQFGEALEAVALAHEGHEVGGSREVRRAERVDGVAPSGVDDCRQCLDVDDVVWVEPHAA